MFDALEELRVIVDRLDIPADARALAGVVDIISALQAKLAAAVAVFDEHKLWDTTGATSMTGWLRDHGMTGAAGRRLSTVAAKVAALPVTAAAWTEGKLSVGQVEIICAQLPDEKYVNLFAQHETGVVPGLMDLTIAGTTGAMKEWRQKADAILENDEPADHDRELHLSKTLDGRWIARASFGTEDGEVVHTALLVATTKDADGEPARTPTQRRADAIVDICRFFLDHQHDRPAHRHRPHINVIVRSDGNGGWQGETTDGAPLRTAVTETLVCDSIIHRYVTDDTGIILDYGTGRDTVPMGLFNAVQTRDRGCRYPGCDRPPRWCDAHHVKPVDQHGATNPDNVVLLCNRHHHLIHRRAWTATMTPGGTLQVTSPDGTTRVSRPPGTVRLKC